MTNLYKSCTLYGNWVEERAEPLRGVVADYGDRRYETTQKAEFPEAVPQRDLTRARILQAQGGSMMFTQQDTWEAATVASRRVDPTGFAGKPSHQPVAPSFLTAYGAAFGRPDGPPQPPDMPAIGRSGLRQERGMRTSGMIGEVFKSDPDPQRSTAAQRVWLPTSTLIIDPAHRAPE